MDIEFATNTGGRLKTHSLYIGCAENFNDSLVSVEVESYGDTKEDAKKEAIARLDELKDKIEETISKLKCA